MEINITFDCDEEKEKKIRSILPELLAAVDSKRHLVHISRLIDETTDIYKTECIMQNTIIMREMSLQDVINVQMSIDEDIIGGHINNDRED
jgi:hypothetical protein